MHNLDRVLNQQEVFNEVAQGAGGYGMSAGEFDPEMFESGEYGAGMSGETWGEVYGEAAETELAAELLTVNNEADMEQFLGKLFSSVAKGVGNFARSGVGRALGSALKQVAKTALPTVGAALGSAIPIPGVGTAIGTMAGKALANALEVESGELVGEARDFEMAQQVVRLAKAATQQAVSAPSGANPGQIAAQSVRNALNSVTAGGLSAGARGPGATGRRNSGRWIRRGNAIILIGA